MSGLAESYRAALPGPRQSAAPDDEALEGMLAALYARGRRAHPALSLAATTFAAHLAGCGACVTDDPGEDEVADLFLAAAALDGDAPAVDELRRRCWPAALRYLRRFDARAAELDDLAQELWNALLIVRDGGAPKLASYSGRGPLPAFVGIAAQRIAMNRLRHEETEARVTERAAAEMRALAGDAELVFIKQRYRDCFQAALGDALRALDDRTRVVLRMHLVDGLSVERIGKAYGVSQSTVSRWLAKGRDSVARETRRLLAEQTRMSESEFDSLWPLVASQLDLSMSHVLDRFA